MYRRNRGKLKGVDYSNLFQVVDSVKMNHTMYTLNTEQFGELSVGAQQEVRRVLGLNRPPPVEIPPLPLDILAGMAGGGGHATPPSYYENNNRAPPPAPRAYGGRRRVILNPEEDDSDDEGFDVNTPPGLVPLGPAPNLSHLERDYEIQNNNNIQRNLANDLAGAAQNTNEERLVNEAIELLALERGVNDREKRLSNVLNKIRQMYSHDTLVTLQIQRELQGSGL